MLNLHNVLNNNQRVSDEINDIFAHEKKGNLLFLNAPSFKSNLQCSSSIKERIAGNIVRLDSSLVSDNEFVRRLGNVSASFGKWTLKNITIKANTLFAYDETTVDENLNEITPLGYFNENVQVPAVFEGKRIWMSVVPHEIFTMQKAISEAKGKVLAYGLGLGYFPLMAAMKNEVSEVVVVEKEQEPIDLYIKCIAPHFEAAKKIKIIKEEAFKHASEIKDGDFDIIFADIWHDAEDGLLLYKEFLKEFASFKETKVFCWIEETILTYAKRIVEILLIEKEQGYGEDDYKEAENEEDELINSFYRVTKESLNEKDVLSSGSIKSILLKM